jgi:hypothetical protein
MDPAQRGAGWLPPNVFSLLIVILIAANYFSAFGDLDFSWQVRTGERIVRTGELRPTDDFTYTIAGSRVPDFEWLYEVSLWGIWCVSGYGGLKLLRVLLVAAPLLLLALRLRREGVAWHGIALALGVAVVVLAPAWNLRPLCCTTIGLLLVSGWLHDHGSGRRPLPWLLPLVMLLWANLHPGVITGQGLLAGAIGWEWLNRWLRLDPPLDRRACRRLTVIGGLGLAATFLSPDPLERLLYPFRSEVSHPHAAHIYGDAAAAHVPALAALHGGPRLHCRRRCRADRGSALPAVSPVGSGPAARAGRPGKRGLPQLARLAAGDAGPGSAAPRSPATTDRPSSAAGWLGTSAGRGPPRGRSASLCGWTALASASSTVRCCAGKGSGRPWRSADWSSCR